MKSPKSLVLLLVIIVVFSSLYRAIPGRPFGFAPQWALAIFVGAIVKDKKWAFIIPVLSMLLSDLVYQVLYIAGISSIPGIYEGAWINYLVFGSVTVFGFMIRKITVVNVFIMSLLAPTYFFIVSNFLTWLGVGEYIEYPKTWDGLMACYTAGLPFYRNSLFATLVFSAILFGAYVLITRRRGSLAKA